MDRPSRSLAYLTSQYPMLSMIFVIREVLQLREMGFRIDVASVNAPDRPLTAMTPEEATECEHAYHLKVHGPRGALAAHFKSFFRNITGYFRGLRMVFRLGGLDLSRLLLNFFYFTQALMVGVWMQSKQQRHLHVHLASQAATIGLYTREVFHFGLSITAHGPDEFYDVDRQYLALKVAAADFICCISFYARSQLMRLSPYVHWSKLLVCRLGVDSTVFAPRAKRPSPEVFEILCVGRLTPFKGQHILIDAVERLAQQGRRVRLRLVGPGDQSVLREHAAKLQDPGIVIFEGGVNQDRIRDIYAAADVFCIASFAEGIPVVLMEAMTMEIPCVTTHITGIPELIRHGIDGLLVAPSDVEGLADAIASLMDDPGLRDRLGKSARERVLQHYNLRRSVEALAAIFDERVK